MHIPVNPQRYACATPGFVCTTEYQLAGISLTSTKWIALAACIKVMFSFLGHHAIGYHMSEFINPMFFIKLFVVVL